MRRESATVEELQNLIQQRINEIASVADGESVNAPTVLRQAPDVEGCNWTVDAYAGPPAYASVVGMIINVRREHYKLAE